MVGQAPTYLDMFLDSFACKTGCRPSWHLLPTKNLKDETYKCSVTYKYIYIVKNHTIGTLWLVTNQLMVKIIEPMNVKQGQKAS